MFKVESMEKVIRDGKVAVLHTEGFGAGWYTWNDHREELVYLPKVVDMVLNGRNDEIDEKWVAENLGEEYADIYCGGACNLAVKWLPIGTRFYIKEYDGVEIIITEEEFLTA